MGDRVKSKKALIYLLLLGFGFPGLLHKKIRQEWFTENIDSQEITHIPKDNLEIVDLHKVVEISQALNLLVRLS